VGQTRCEKLNHNIISHCDDVGMYDGQRDQLAQPTHRSYVEETLNKTEPKRNRSISLGNKSIESVEHADCSCLVVKRSPSGWLVIHSCIVFISWSMSLNAQRQSVIYSSLDCESLYVS